MNWRKLFKLWLFYELFFSGDNDRSSHTIDFVHDDDVND